MYLRVFASFDLMFRCGVDIVKTNYIQLDESSLLDMLQMGLGDSCMEHFNVMLFLAFG